MYMPRVLCACLLLMTSAIGLVAAEDAGYRDSEMSPQVMPDIQLDTVTNHKYFLR